MPEIDTNWLQNEHSSFASAFSAEILKVETFRGDRSINVQPSRMPEMASFLKNELGYNVLMDLFAMDYSKYSLEMPERFAVIYHFYSTKHHQRLFLKAWIKEEKPEVPTLCEVYKAANWFEREAWDLFGVQFVGHPNLTRILCHHDFVGHPLQKDYPADKYQRLKQAVPSAEF